MKRFSKTVSVTTPVPSEMAIIAMNWACMSVGKPGYGIVLMSTDFVRRSHVTRMPLTSSSIVTPASLSLAMTGLRCSLIAFSM